MSGKPKKKRSGDELEEKRGKRGEEDDDLDTDPAGVDEPEEFEDEDDEWLDGGGDEEDSY